MQQDDNHAAVAAGFVLNGHLITCAHIFPTSTKEGDELPEGRKILCLQPESDLCVIALPEDQLAKFREDKLEMKVGPSPQVGQLLVTAGFPSMKDVDREKVITAGYVSGSTDKGWLLASVPCTWGNSGGPVCDRNGFVIGMLNGGSLVKTPVPRQEHRPGKCIDAKFSKISGGSKTIAPGPVLDSELKRLEQGSFGGNAQAKIIPVVLVVIDRHLGDVIVNPDDVPLPSSDDEKYSAKFSFRLGSEQAWDSSV